MIKPEQYEVLVKLMRGNPKSAANRAAKRVLVDGVSQSTARQETGVTRATVSNAVKRYTQADKMVREVYLPPDGQDAAGADAPATSAE